MTETERFTDLEKDMAELAAKMGPAMQTYWNYSRNRFRYQSTLVRRLLATASWKRPVRLLDVGPSFQTRLFERMLGPKAHIDTFGFPDPKFPPPPGGTHITYDLNDAIDPRSWPKPEPYQLVTFFEVVEHLYTSPIPVLRCLRSLLHPGGLLALSTPNALALQHRVKMLLGHHPYEQIREDRTNPGHFRESTAPGTQSDGAGRGVGSSRGHNLQSRLDGFTGQQSFSRHFPDPAPQPPQGNRCYLPETPTEANADLHARPV